MKMKLNPKAKRKIITLSLTEEMHARLLRSWMALPEPRLKLAGYASHLLRLAIVGLKQQPQQRPKPARKDPRTGSSPLFWIT